MDWKAPLRAHSASSASYLPMAPKRILHTTDPESPERAMRLGWARSAMSPLTIWPQAYTTAKQVCIRPAAEGVI